MTDHDAGCNVTPIDSILALWHCHATKYFIDARICSIFAKGRYFVPAVECHDYMMEKISLKAAQSFRCPF